MNSLPRTARRRFFLAAFYTLLLAIGAGASIAASYSPRLQAQEEARVARHAGSVDLRGS